MSDRSEPMVYVVDDDEAVRYGLRMLLETAGYEVADFGTAQAFLDSYRHDVPGCLILDIQMPGTSGLELQEMLAARNLDTPIIFLTGHGSVPAAVKALKGGAVDFFQKPIANEQLLLDRVSEAIRQDIDAREEAGKRADAKARLETLTPREIEVMDRICRGNANKVVAAELGISERTVELHRAHLMKKLGVRSMAELMTVRNTLNGP